jgi:3-hydroxyisobutyrate dehydrogenase-like beta-hydroxyacid dehydrogenase
MIGCHNSHTGERMEFHSSASITANRSFGARQKKMIKRSLNVGVVGLGKMGVPIARNLAFRSRTALYLQLYARDRAHVAQVSDDIARDGAQCAIRLHHQLATVTKWCDVVVTCLKDGDALSDVMLARDDALLRHARAGQIFIDHTTVDVNLARRCAAAAERRGAFYLDCPVSGSPQLAQAGELTAMCGGPQQAFGKVLALLRLYCENAELIGPSGSGAAAKLVCQSLVAMHAVAAAEAMTIAEGLGIEQRAKLFAVLDASWGASTMLRRNAPLMERLIRNPELVPDAPASTSVDRVLDDITLIGRATQLRPEALPVFAKAHNILWRASSGGVGDRDISGVVHFLESDGAADPLAGSAAATAAANGAAEAANCAGAGAEARADAGGDPQPLVATPEEAEVY